MYKKYYLIFLVGALLFSSCNKNTNSSNMSSNGSNTSSQTPGSSEEPPYENNQPISIDNNLEYAIEIEDGLISLTAYTACESGIHTLYYCFNKDKGLDENNAYKFIYDFPSMSSSYYAYNGADYVLEGNSPISAAYSYDSETNLYITEFAITCDLTTNDLLDHFSFYPEFFGGGILMNFTKTWVYMRNNYPQTWFSLNEKGDIYFDKSFETLEISDWTRPSLKNKEGSHLAFSCSETTIEGARVSAICAERMGATAFDLHIEGFNSSGLLNIQNIERITKAVRIPVLAIFYDGGQSQQTRLNGLKIAVQGGAAAVDLQGFMYWEGSTLNTQTAANISYWEGQGFDMSFTSAHPVETILDIDAINNQKAYIQDIHNMGAEVLLSSHNKAVYTKEQAIAYAKFIESRDVDVIKLVGYGYNTEDIEACIEANKAMDQEVSCKFTFHLQTDEHMQITRLVCPLYYGAFIAFCYYNMTHLNMMVELSKGNIPSKNTSLEDVITYMQGHTTHSELASVIATYRSCPAPSPYVVHAYGQSSEMSYKWDCGNGYSHIALREETSSNSFNIRAYAYKKNHKATTFSYSCSISGKFYPYVSSSRNPKVGIMLGSEDSMLAFVYETNTKTIDLMHNETVFGYDDPKSDRLYTMNKFVSPTYTTSVDDLGKINMGIYADENYLKLYFSEGDNDLSLVTTINMSDVESCIGGEGNVGSVLELYLGSASANKTNYLHFDNIVFSKDVNILEI